MKRISFYADEQMLDEVRRAAAHENISASQFIRDAIRARIPGQGPASHRFAFTGKYASGRTDIAERYRELLGREKR